MDIHLYIEDMHSYAAQTGTQTQINESWSSGTFITKQRCPIYIRKTTQHSAE